MTNLHTLDQLKLLTNTQPFPGVAVSHLSDPNSLGVIVSFSERAVIGTVVSVLWSQITLSALYGAEPGFVIWDSSIMNIFKNQNPCIEIIK